MKKMNLPFKVWACVAGLFVTFLTSLVLLSNNVFYLTATALNYMVASPWTYTALGIILFIERPLPARSA
jgi:hypothetical protein